MIMALYQMESTLSQNVKISTTSYYAHCLMHVNLEITVNVKSQQVQESKQINQQGTARRSVRARQKIW